MAVHKVERRKAPAAGRVRILHFRFAKNPFGLFAGFVLPKTKYARSDDVRIAYQISGDGPFDVVWAPGTMSHLDLDWEIPQRALFFERFSKFCRLIRFDKRGTGLSDRPVKMATLEERTDDIRAVMDDVGIERANIFGVSEGGSMACLFAASYPQRVNSLLVWGAQARWIGSPDHPWGQTHEEHNQMIAMIQDDWPSFEYITGPGAGVGKDADPAYIESISRYMRAAASPSAVYAYEQMNGQIDTRPHSPVHSGAHVGAEPHRRSLCSCGSGARYGFADSGREI